MRKSFFDKNEKWIFRAFLGFLFLSLALVILNTRERNRKAAKVELLSLREKISIGEPEEKV
jgi:hypothetical protein